MIFSKFAIHAVLVLAVITCAGVTFAAAKDWSGVYSHTEESLEPDGSRFSYWFRLEVTEDGTGKLTAELTNGANSKTTRHIQLTGAAGPMRAQFLYDRCLPLKAEKGATCTDTEFHHNDQLFVLQETPRHCQSVLETEWQKLNLARETEMGDQTERSDFFKNILG
ncbi:MAG: hypothetical protein ABI878_09975 [Acidobacteriota bacterium]